MCFKRNIELIALERVRKWRLKKPYQKEPYIYELTIMTADLESNLRSQVLDAINKILTNERQNASI